MLAFVTGNLGTILITLFLVLIVALAIHTLVKDKRQGRSSCGGSCASCGACGSCAGSGISPSAPAGTKKGTKK